MGASLPPSVRHRKSYVAKNTRSGKRRTAATTKSVPFNLTSETSSYTLDTSGLDASAESALTKTDSGGYDSDDDDKNKKMKKWEAGEADEVDYGTNVDWIGRWIIVPSYIIVMGTLLTTGWGFTGSVNHG